METKDAYISLIKEVYIMGIYGNYLLEGFFSKKKKDAAFITASFYSDYVDFTRKQKRALL